MKKYLIQIMALIVIISTINAQVTEGKVEFKFGEHNAMQIVLVDVDKNLVEDVWKKQTKAFGKTDKKKGEFVTKEVLLEGLSNPVDWFMKLEKDNKNILLQLCSTSQEEFLSSANQPVNYGVIAAYLENFAYKVEKAKLKDELSKEQKALTKLQDKLKKIRKDYDNNIDSAKKHSKKIGKSEKENKSLVEKQLNIKETIAEQVVLVNNLLSEEGEESEGYKEEKSKLSKLQKKLENYAGDYKKNLKTINKSSNKIEDTKDENKSLKKDEKKVKDKITKQGKKVELVRQQLEAMN